MKVRLRVNVSQWAWGDGDESHVLVGGVHDLPNEDVKLSKGFLKAIGSTAAADPSALHVVSSDDEAKQAMTAHIESDAESRKALDKAMGKWDPEREMWTGPWYAGHLQAQAEFHKSALAEAKASGDAEAKRVAEIRLGQVNEKIASLGGEA